MTFMQLAKRRFSVRNFQKKEVEEAKLKQVLEAARVAPSAVNFQPLHFIVLRTEEMRKKVAETYKGKWLIEAPVIIVVCGDHKTSWHRADGKDHCDIDAAIAIDHMMLAATELGLGTCWVCAFDAEKCRTVFELPDHIEPIALVPLGYPAREPDENRHETKRKSLAELVQWEEFNLSLN